MDIYETKQTIVKPIIKWVGGKSQILDKVLSLFPKNIDDYHETFVGGGSVLLGVLQNKKINGKSYAYDLNSDLISLYKNIQKNPRLIIRELSILQKEYYNLGEEDSEQGGDNTPNTPKTPETQESYYYNIRDRYNKEKKGTILSSSMFIFLNKTCFRGLYRVGPKGFNVPFGNYKKPCILDANNILDVSELINNVEFIHCSFEECLFWKNANKGDFIYFDPPYAPESSTSFVKYNKEGFTVEKHKELFSLIKKLKSCFLLSNSNVKLVTDCFIDYNKEILNCKRSINSKNPSMKTEEVLIYKM